MNHEKSFIRSVLLQDSYWILNKSLVRQFGVEPALLLADLLSKEQYFEAKGLLSDDGYFFNTLENINTDTSIPVYTQRKAIKKLQECKILSVVLRGVPCRQWFKINYVYLAEFLSFPKTQYLSGESEKSVMPDEQTINKNKLNKNKDNTTCSEAPPVSDEINDLSGTITNIFARAFGRKALPYEFEDTEKLLELFSPDVIVRAFKDGGRDGCRKIKTIISRIDESGKYIEFQKEHKSNESLSNQRTKYQPDRDKARSRLDDLKNNFGRGD